MLRFLILGCCAVLLYANTLAASPPNILFIYLDDFGWRDTGYAGSDFYETPHLDQLAAQGVQFTNAYSCAANCAPARASLMSGRYSPRHQIFNVGTGPRGKATHRRLLHVAGTDTLDPALTTWAARLKASGYATGIFGKWHLSENPLDYGFDVNIGGSHSGSPPRGYYPPHPRVPALEQAESDEYLTDRLTDETIKFIEDHVDRPWCAYLSHFAVHTPLNARRDLLPKYENKPAGKLHQHVAMATMIEAVDQGVGKIMSVLDELDLAENTVVIFSSDNGGYGPATDMYPLKGYKGTYYEGGIRVPLVIHWPQGISSARVVDTPVIAVSLYPTICELAGVELPEAVQLDGLSLMPLLKEEAEIPSDRALFWHFPAYLQAYQVWDEQRDPLFRSRPVSVIRKDRWKLIENFETNDFELYDLKQDVGETTNLAAREPEVLHRLLAELRGWQEKSDAPIPDQRNPQFDPRKERQAIEAILSKSK